MAGLCFSATFPVSIIHAHSARASLPPHSLTILGPSTTYACCHTQKKEEAQHAARVSPGGVLGGGEGSDGAPAGGIPPFPDAAKYDGDWSAEGIPIREHQSLFSDTRASIRNDVDFTPTPSTLQHLPSVSMQSWHDFWCGAQEASVQPPTDGEVSEGDSTVDFRVKRGALEKHAGEVAFGALQATWTLEVHQLVVDNVSVVVALWCSGCLGVIVPPFCPAPHGGADMPHSGGPFIDGMFASGGPYVSRRSGCLSRLRRWSIFL